MFEEFRNTEWGKADGTRVVIKEMDLGHLVNVVNWVHDHKDRYSDRIRNGFLEEVRGRQFALFATKQPYPCLIDGRWKVMDPDTGTASIIRPPDEYLEAVKDNPVYQEMSEWVQKERKNMRKPKG